MIPFIVRISMLLVLTTTIVMGTFRRNAVTDPSQLWPDGIVPYTFHPHIDAYRRVHMMAGMKQIMTSTYSGGQACIRFAPRTTETDYIQIEFVSEDESVGAHVGRKGGMQSVSILKPINQDNIIQVLMFTIGINPEVKRTDRGNYLEIVESNVEASFAHNFLIEADTDTFSQPFDYDTVMMYNPYSGAINKTLPSIKTKFEGYTIGQTVSLSTDDVNLVQHAYGCQLDSSHNIDILGPLLLECHFHFDFCDFTQDGDFDWELDDGAFSGLGPLADHSSGTGYYAVAVSQDHNSQVARMSTRVLPSGTYCVVVWLFVYGDDIGSLRVIQTNDDGDKTLINVNSATPIRQWYHASATVDSDSSVTVSLEALMGQGDLGDIAVDDIYVYKGKCIDWF